MRELVYYVATTIDGQIAATDGSTPGFVDDPGYLADLHRTYADALPGPAQAALRLKPPLTQWDTVLMGRRTYEIGLEQGVTSPYPHLDQYVFSRRLAESPSTEVTLVSEDPLDFVRLLRREPGGSIWLCGGGHLASALAGEIDRLLVKVNPVALGSGVPLFAGLEKPVNWRLASTRTFPAGVVLLEYLK